MPKWAELSEPERDMLIAEKVMGWRYVPYTAYCGGTPEQAKALAIERGWYTWEDAAGEEPAEGLPDYTADMNAAMTVVEKLHADRQGIIAPGRAYILTLQYGGLYWYATFSVMTGSAVRANKGMALADTPAEAICHAAALAVGAVED
jgi:hypothetical protein